MTGKTTFYPRQGTAENAVATCDRVLDTDTGTAPEWVHLLPMGAVEGRDGRAWTLDDPRGVVSAFNAGKIDLPIDYEHQSGKPDPGGSGPFPAAGWIKKLMVATNGLWGSVALRVTPID